MLDVYPVYLKLGWKHSVSSVSVLSQTRYTHRNDDQCQLHNKLHRYTISRRIRGVKFPTGVSLSPEICANQPRLNPCDRRPCEARKIFGFRGHRKADLLQKSGGHRATRAPREIAKPTFPFRSGLRAHTRSPTRGMPDATCQWTVYLALYLVCICFQARYTVYLMYLHPSPCVSPI